jgi:GntR family transcriptional regulator of arabinose operon
MCAASLALNAKGLLVKPEMDTLMPKHAHLRSVLSNLIQDGNWSSGQKLPSEAQLSSQYGVSRTTIIRALRDMESDGLVTRRQGAGTFVSNDHTGRQTIGVLIPGLATNDIFLSVQRHIFRQSSRFNWQVLTGEVLLPGDNDAAGHAPVVAAKKLVQSGVCGVIMVPHHVDGQSDKCNDSMLNVFLNAKLPVVLLDRDFHEAPHRSSYDLVSLDNSRAGFELGCHFLERGKRHLVYIGNPHAYPSTHTRISGVRKALALQNLSLPEERVVEASDEGFSAIVKHIEAGEVDGVVCNSDHDAALFMRRCLEAGLAIPDQVSIAGFDNQPVARLLAVPLTTVAQPVQSLAIRAISTLQDRIAFPDTAQATIRIKGELIIRSST